VAGAGKMNTAARTSGKNTRLIKGRFFIICSGSLGKRVFPTFVIKPSVVRPGLF
jgi:hypothetical protein